MGKKVKLLPSLFKNKETMNPWQWPSCKHPKTLSFRAAGDDMFKTVNSVFFDPSETPPESWFTNSPESASFSTESEENVNNNLTGEESLELIIRGIQRSSERLFFDPDDTNSIVDQEVKSNETSLPFKESVVLAMESEDPYVDFKRSMEEMVESQGLKEWECLEELLEWYLKMNGKMNHGYIIGAFVDLLVELASSTSPEYSTSFSSAASSFSTLSSPQSVVSRKEIDGEHKLTIS